MSSELNVDAPEFKSKKVSRWVSKTRLAKQESTQTPTKAPGSEMNTPRELREQPKSRFDFAQRTPKSAPPTFAKGPDDWRQAVTPKQTSQTPTTAMISAKRKCKIDTEFRTPIPTGLATAPAASLHRLPLQKTNLKEVKHVCRGCRKVLNSSLQLVEHQNGRSCPANNRMSPQSAPPTATYAAQSVQIPRVNMPITPMASPLAKFQELAISTPTNSVTGVAMKLNSLITLVIEQHGKLKSAIELCNSQTKEIQHLKAKLDTLEQLAPQAVPEESNKPKTPVSILSANSIIKQEIKEEPEY